MKGINEVRVYNISREKEIKYREKLIKDDNKWRERNI